MRWRLALGLIFLIISVFLTKWPDSWQPFLEVVYGEKLYPSIQKLLIYLPNPKRFALMDVLWIAIPLLYILRLWWLARKNMVRRIPLLLSETLLWASTGYLLFMLMWGLNYHRAPLYNNLTKQGFTSNLVTGHWDFALKETLGVLNKLPQDVDICNTDPLFFSTTRPSSFAHSAMTLANLPPTPPREIKTSIWSPVYTRLSTAGVYIPFTGEPTVNKDIFTYAQPFTMLHEYFHWAGYAREYDADILAYWSAWLSPDPIWQYSGWLVWWANMSAPDAISEKMPVQLKNGIRCYVEHIKNQPRWKIQKTMWTVYEANLKNQGISEGLSSYGMGEPLALSSYQDWLFKKRNRTPN